MTDVPLILPQNPAAEEALLASVILDNEQAFAVMAQVTAGDFYDPRLGAVYSAVQRCLNNGEPADLVTLVPRLQHEPAYQGLGVDGLVGIMESEHSGGRAMAYARIVRDAADRRRLVQVAQRAIQLACEEGHSPGEAYAGAEAEILTAISQHRRADLSPAADLIDDILAEADAALEDGGASRGVRTGLVDLDATLGGLQRGATYVLAGRPSMGKSSLATSIARNVALVQELPVLFFSLEVPTKQVLCNIACADSKTENESLWKGQLDGAQHGRWRSSAERIRAAPLILNDTPAIAASQIRAATRVARGRWGIELVIVDYLQLVTSDERPFSREREVAEISAMLKATAQECDVPIIVLSQLNRAVELRKNQLPRMADLRDSGAIEQDADVVMLLYREAYYKSEKDTNGQEAVLMVAKNRNGPTGSVRLAFFPKWTAFENLAKDSVGLSEGWGA